MDDLISRQAAIDALDQIFDRCEEIEAHLPEGDPDRTGYKMYPDYMTLWKYLHQLPSAHPLDPCETCLHKSKGWYEDPCDGCTGAESKYEPDNGWIPVSERLPEEGQSCLVTEVITNGMKSVLIAKFANDLYKIDKYDFARRKGEHGWFCYDYEHGRCYDVDVIAWMPLPEPMELEED